LIEVWRPGGRSDERRPRHDRNRPRHGGDRGQQNRPQRQGGEAVAASGEAAAAPADGDKREQPRHGRRGDKFKDFRRPRDGAPAQVAAPADGAAPREERGGHPRPALEGKGRDNERPGGDDRPKQKGKFGGDRGGRDQSRDNKGGRDRRDNGPSLRPFASSATPRDRDRQADPNSPFAKLAALKEQLAANRKD
jgi:ATP-dependent RNA helicase SUPV3L1/SUV3